MKKIPVGDSRQWLANALKEVRVLERLRHPNIVSYYHSWLERAQTTDFGPEVPCLFILMEYVVCYPRHCNVSEGAYLYALLFIFLLSPFSFLTVTFLFLFFSFSLSVSTTTDLRTKALSQIGFFPKSTIIFSDSSVKKKRESFTKPKPSLPTLHPRPPTLSPPTSPSKQRWTFTFPRPFSPSTRRILRKAWKKSRKRAKKRPYLFFAIFPVFMSKFPLKPTFQQRETTARSRFLILLPPRTWKSCLSHQVKSAH